MLYKIGVLKSFGKFARKHLHWSLIFKVAGFQLSAYNFIKKDSPAQVYSFKFDEFFRILFSQTTFWRLLSADLIKILGNNYREASENINKNESHEAKDLHKIYKKVT